MAHRYFTQNIAGDVAHITGGDAAHLHRVLRAQPGTRLTLCDGAGHDYDAEITSITAQAVVLRVLGSRPCVAEPSLWAEVFLGYSRGERMDFAVQKSVELGASAITPFFSKNTVVKPKKIEEKTTRLGRIAAEAAKQCGRGMLPQVHAPLPFAEMLEKAAAQPLALFAWEEEGQSLREVFAPGAPVPKSVALITGAEGGFAPEEAAAARAAGCQWVHFGPRILRSETAPAALLCAVMLLSGNLE